MVGGWQTPEAGMSDRTPIFRFWGRWSFLTMADTITQYTIHLRPIFIQQIFSTGFLCSILEDELVGKGPSHVARIFGQYSTIRGAFSEVSVKRGWSLVLGGRGTSLC